MRTGPRSMPWSRSGEPDDAPEQSAFSRVRTGTVFSMKSISDMAVDVDDEENAPAWRQRAVSRSLQRRALTRRAARPALPRRRVRADRREGHDRVHDPGGHRPLEAVAARLLPVLRRQGRAAARAVRGDDPRVDRRPPRASSRPSPNRSTRLRAFTIRLHEWCEPVRHSRASAASHNRRPISEFSVQLAVDAPRAREGRDGAGLAHAARARRGRATAAGAIDVADARRAAALVQQTVMYSWFGNRLIQDPRMRLTAEETWEFCLHGLSAERLTASPTRSDAVEVEHPDRVAAQHLVALLVGERRGHRARPPRCANGHVVSVCG